MDPRSNLKEPICNIFPARRNTIICINFVNEDSLVSISEVRLYQS